MFERQIVCRVHITIQLHFKYCYNVVFLFHGSQYSNPKYLKMDSTQKPVLQETNMLLRYQEMVMCTVQELKQEMYTFDSLERQNSCFHEQEKHSEETQESYRIWGLRKQEEQENYRIFQQLGLNQKQLHKKQQSWKIHTGNLCSKQVKQSKQEQDSSVWWEQVD